MSKTIKIGNNIVGENRSSYITAEIGINHNGDLDIAKRMIAAAVTANCDAVKFQKRTPESCISEEQKDILRETPWGLIKYIDYRHKVEFWQKEYEAIDRYCKEVGIEWYASCWDQPSVDFMKQFDLPCYKIASACLTDDDLLRKHRDTGKPVILSTGMSTLEQVDHAVEVLGKDDLVLMHCNSSYPAKAEELNLKVIITLKGRYGVPVGYSGHEVGLSPSVAASVLGACLIERHITLDRAMWGSDQAASVEPYGFGRLVRDVRAVEMSLGDGVKRVYDSELAVMKKLRIFK